MLPKRSLFAVFCFFSACTYQADIQFEAVKQVDTAKAYKRFLIEYPNSIYTADILDLLEVSELNNVIASKNDAEFNRFIQEYPNSPYLPELLKAKANLTIEQIFDEVKAENSLKGYINFIDKYPNNNLSKEAEKLIYQKRLADNLAQEPVKSISQKRLADNLAQEPVNIDSQSLTETQTNLKFNAKTSKSDQSSADNTKIHKAQSQSQDLLRADEQSQVPTIRISNATARAPIGTLGEQDRQMRGGTELRAGNKATIKESELILETIPKSIAPIMIPKKLTIVAKPQDVNPTQVIKTNPQAVNPNQVIETNPLFQSKQVKPPQDFSYLIDTSSIALQDSPEIVLYGKVFQAATSPRIIQAEFTLFIQTLQRTNNYIRVKTRFHNLAKTKKKFRFTKVTLVNNIGRRVKPINVLGVNWKLSESGVVESEHSPNEISELDFLFPALNLFNANNYKFYITLNNKNYLIQI